MARFARNCLSTMKDVVQKLELTLGPDTGKPKSRLLSTVLHDTLSIGDSYAFLLLRPAELGMRFGLHSGPVTAGVLRGEKSRFQLFGDTVNTAARMESTGAKNRIHISPETAKLLIDSGKTAWVKPRQTLTFVKGKGDMQTYWLDFASRSTQSTATASIAGSIAAPTDMIQVDKSDDGASVDVTLASEINDDVAISAHETNTKRDRLIRWNVDTLQRLLKKIVAMRDDQAPPDASKWKGLKIETMEGATVLDEVKEIITLPSHTAEYRQDPDLVELDPAVVSQLTEYVSVIASTYRDNPFHSFEHASHVTQSVRKLLSRVVTQDSIDYEGLRYTRKAAPQTLHEYTFGITSDPLTQFAVVFSAMIHDVDHFGIPNTQLVKEKAEIAVLYREKSVAEQHSVDIAWDLLMQPEFSDLRSCIYATQSELDRFRQLVVNAVMATDIMDKELGTLRKNRWEKAFASSTRQSQEASADDVNRKATIVIEHLIQASDVAHTMQHWHVYVKWNERLFHEMYKAFQDGRADKDPSVGWYEGELGFFDFYIIPLAKKLKECGVFGVASDEYLNYATTNRNEWEKKGREVVDMFLSRYSKKG